MHANADVSRFVCFQEKFLVVIGRSARFDLADEITVVVHVESPGPLRSLVESDVEHDDVLRFAEVVVNAAQPRYFFNELALARPAGVRIETAIPRVIGRAAVRAATKPFRPLIMRRSLNCHRSALGNIHEGFSRGGRSSEG